MLKQTLVKLLFVSLFLFTLPALGVNMTTKEAKLDNGLKIVVREDHRAPVIVSQVWFKVGSADEYTGITGISHALEHMMFKGTKKFPDGSYSDIIAKNGGTDNAFTTDDFTAYYAELDASKLELSFELEADRMQNLIITAEEFAKEKQVIKEERRLRTDDNPQMLTYERFMAAANISGPYHHPVIGWMHDIEQMTAEDLQMWYDNWYGPNNAVLVVAGDVDADKVIELAKKHFGKVTKKALLKTKNYQEIGALGETRIVVKKKAMLPYLMFGYNVPAISEFTKEESYAPYALLLAAYALDGGNSSRFSKTLIRRDELAIGLGTYYDPFQRYSSQFKLTGIPAGKHTVEDLEKGILSQIELLKTELIGDAELNKIKTQIISSEIFGKDSIAEQAITIGSFECIGLSWKDAEQYVENIKAVTAEQIKEVVEKYLVSDQKTVAILDPQAIQDSSETQGEGASL